MKKSLKSILAAALAGVMTLTSLSITSFATSQTDPPTPPAAPTSKYNGRIYAGIDDVSQIVMWVGGGKSKLANGASVDGKTAELKYYEDLDMYDNVDTTASANILWVTSDSAFAATEYDTLKEAKAALAAKTALSANIKVSKGKVSVSAKTVPESPTCYVGVVALNKNDKYSVVDSVEVTLQQSAEVVQILKDSKDTEVTKAANVLLGDTASFVIAGKTKAGVAANENATYTATIPAKSKGLVGFVIEEADGKASIVDSITVGQGDELTIAAVGYDFEKAKASKVAVTVTNDQSGKKASIAITVSNGIASVADDATAIAVEVDAADVKPTVESAVIKGYLETAAANLAAAGADDAVAKAIQDYIIANNKTVADKDAIAALATTDTKATVFVSEAKLDVEKMIANGKVKFSGTKSKTVTAKLDSKTGDLSLVVKKTATAGTYYVYIAYNAETETTTVEGASVTTATGILCIPVNVTKKAAEAEGVTVSGTIGEFTSDAASFTGDTVNVVLTAGSQTYKSSNITLEVKGQAADSYKTKGGVAFSVANVPAGTYAVTITGTGFTYTVTTGASVTVTDTAKSDCALAGSYAAK